MNLRKNDSERPSMQNVANYAGVSVATVSKVMRGVSTIKQENVVAVQNAIEALGYRINPIASELRRGKSQVVGCIIPAFGDPIVGAFVQALEACAESSGYSILAVSSRFSSKRESELALRLQDLRVAGIVWVPHSSASADTARIIVETNLSCVAVAAQPLDAAIAMVAQNPNIAIGVPSRRDAADPVVTEQFYPNRLAKNDPFLIRSGMQKFCIENDQISDAESLCLSLQYWTADDEVFIWVEGEHEQVEISWKLSMARFAQAAFSKVATHREATGRENTIELLD
jgi:hypothetical protein